MPYNDSPCFVELKSQPDSTEDVPGWPAGARRILILIAASWLIPLAIAILR